MTPAFGYPVSLVSPDSAAAVALNPAALGNLSGWSILFSHVDGAGDAAYHDRADGAFLASPLGDHLALGLGLSFLRPESDARPDQNGVFMAAGLNLGPHWTFGASWHLRSPRDDSPNVHTADVALSFQPAPVLGFSLMGRDLAAKRVQLGADRIVRSGLFAISARPLGDDRLTLELAGLVDQRSATGMRAMAQAFVPWVGHVAVATELTQLDGAEVWTLTGGLDLRWGGLSLAPALHTTADVDGPGWSLAVGIQQVPHPGVPAPPYVTKLALSGLGARGLLAAQLALDRALHDSRVQGVVLLPADTGVGLAAAQELRLWVEALQDAGKPVYCHLESATGSEFYLCAGARRRSLDPAGVIRLMGVATDSLYFGKVLSDFGVRADFVRIGEYKSAPEQYTNRGATEPARRQRKELLDDVYARLVHDLAEDLERTDHDVRDLIDRGPFLPDEAVRADLVAETRDVHDLNAGAQKLYGKKVRVAPPGRPARHRRFGPTGQIGVVVVDGAIVDGDNVDIPLLEVHMSGAHTVVSALDRMADDSRIRAIVLRVDSPGGTVMASDQIWRAVMRARKKKPVVASMGNVAASGGYYVASAASEIWASPSTITGSIGVFYGKVDFAPLAERFGVGIETEKRGAHAGASSLYRPFTDAERAALTGKLRAWYRQFLERVAEGRKQPVEEIDTMARGHVYTGDAAHRLGLVDSLGGFGSALARARELAGLSPDAAVVVAPERPSGLLDYVLGVGGARTTQPSMMVGALKPFLERLMLLEHASATEPMALYEGATGLQ